MNSVLFIEINPAPARFSSKFAVVSSDKIKLQIFKRMNGKMNNKI